MRWLTGGAARKPVAVFMLLITLLILGYIAVTNLKLDLLPNLNIPYAVVATIYPGAGAEEVELLITNPIESAIKMVSGVKKITSTSSDSFSMIIIEFEWGTQLNAAVSRVRTMIDTITTQLPSGVKPMVVEFNPSLLPVYIFSVSGKEDLRTLMEDAKTVVSRASGVANVDILGMPQEVLNIFLSPEKIEKYGLEFSLIPTIIGGNVKYPMGMITENGDVYSLSVDAKYRDLKEFENTIVGFKDMKKMLSGLSALGLSGENSQGSFQLGNLLNPSILKTPIIPIKLNQIAEVKIENEETRGIIRVNGKEAAVLSVQKRGGSNTVEVVRNIKKALKDWQNIRKDVKVTEIMDQSLFTVRSIKSLFQNLIIGAVVATIIMYLFLRSIGATLIISFSMPLSITIALVFMYFSKMGLDLMTLGGLTMAIGMLVDNSIVVLESIFRYLERKRTPLEASEIGAAEVGGAIFASTATTIVIFVPLAFTGGFIAEIFKFFALSLSFALFASLLVALVMIPAASTTFISKSPKTNNGFRLAKRYRVLLRGFLKRKALYSTITIIVFIISVILLLQKGLIFLPDMDTGMVNLTLKLPPQSSYLKTAACASEIENFLWDKREDLKIEMIYSNIGQGQGMLQMLTQGSENSATIQVALKPKRERKLTSQQVVEKVREDIEKIAKKYNASVSLSVNTMELESIFGSPIQVVLVGKNLDKLEEISNKVKEIVKNTPGTVDITTSFDDKKYSYVVDIDRNLSLLSGIIPLQAIGQLQPYLTGQEIGDFVIDEKALKAYLRIENTDNLMLEDLKKIELSSLFGSKVYLGAISKIEKESIASSIPHENGNSVAYVNASVSGRSLSEVTNEINKKLESIKFPAGYSYYFGGQQQLLSETLDRFIFALVVGVILMYMLIAALFESLIQPLVIFSTIPMSLIGVTFMVYVLNMPISVPVLLGAMTLIGVVVNNSIVMINRINQLRESGVEKSKAIVEGAVERLRPILMTTLTTVIALFPTAISKGEGANLDKPIAWTIIGGMLIGLFFTLFFIPSLYDFFDRFSRRFKRFEKRAEQN